MSERIDYDGEGLAEADIHGMSPYAVARDWVQAAVARQAEHGDVPEPLSIAVATVDAQGHPNVRTVLMRFFDERGPGFVTSLTSTKGVELAGNPAMAITLTWPAMFRAIRFRGLAATLDRDEVEAYFDERPYGSRISAWASQQSQPIDSRAALEEAHRLIEERFPDTGDPHAVPAPETWGGFRLVPDRVEFWGGRRSRLHDRIVHTRTGPGTLDDLDAWARQRLQP